MDVRTRLNELAKVAGTAPIVSVYLNTRWADEQQRERVRVFLKNELRKAREVATDPGLRDDLDWIEAQGESLVAQARFPGADGVALFACRALGLREALPVRVPFEDTFVVADRPFLRPLAAVAEAIPSALVVFVDGGSARLIPLDAAGAGEELALESDVPGQHRRGGWAQLAQSRYQRHIQDHRARHFEAVAEALLGLAEATGVAQIVMAGEPRTITAFRRRLPQSLTGRIIASIPAGRRESAGTILGRAAASLAEWQEKSRGAAVDAVLTEAAKSGQAVAALDETLEAAARGAVLRLYLLRTFSEAGRACVRCGALQRGADGPCPRCGEGAKPVELGEALVSRVVATGGTVEMVEAHPGLERVGGVAASLRYAL